MNVFWFFACLWLFARATLGPADMYNVDRFGWSLSLLWMLFLFSVNVTSWYIKMLKKAEKGAIYY